MAGETVAPRPASAPAPPPASTATTAIVEQPRTRRMGSRSHDPAAAFVAELMSGLTELTARPTAVDAACSATLIVDGLLGFWRSRSVATLLLDCASGAVLSVARSPVLKAMCSLVLTAVMGWRWSRPDGGDLGFIPTLLVAAISIKNGVDVRSSANLPAAARAPRSPVAKLERTETDPRGLGKASEAQEDRPKALTKAEQQEITARVASHLDARLVTDWRDVANCAADPQQDKDTFVAVQLSYKDASVIDVTVSPLTQGIIRQLGTSLADMEAQSSDQTELIEANAALGEELRRVSEAAESAAAHAQAQLESALHLIETHEEEQTQNEHKLNHASNWETLAAENHAMHIHIDEQVRRQGGPEEHDRPQAPASFLQSWLRR